MIPRENKVSGICRSGLGKERTRRAITFTCKGMKTFGPHDMPVIDISNSTRKEHDGFFYANFSFTCGHGWPYIVFCSLCKLLFLAIVMKT